MTEVAAVTLPVVTENVAEVEPCGTVTELAPWQQRHSSWKAIRLHRPNRLLKLD